MRLFIPFSTTKKPTTNRFFGCLLKLASFSGTAIYFALSAPLMAAETPRDELTLTQTVELSLQSHPTLASYQYRVKSANAQAQQAAIGEKPEINLTLEDALGTGEHTGLDNAQSTLSISWVLQGGLLDQRVKSAQSKANVLEIERDIQRYDVAAQTAHAFLTVLAYQERLVVAKNTQQHAVQILREIQKRVDAGRSPSADKFQAEVNLERRELEVEDIQHELKSAKKVLASQWGNSSVDFVGVNGALTLKEQVISYDALENGISKNPQVQYFLTQQRVVETEITLAREEVKNRWRFNTGVRRYEATEDYGLTFGVSLPLGKSTRNKHQISALSAEQARYVADARAKEIQLSTQLYVLYEELQHSYHLNYALTHKILPRLERALVETQKAYSLGKYSYREWYALQNEVFDTKMELIDVRLKAHNNLTEIERLTGLNLMGTSSVKEFENNGDIQ
ncbi:TolC family protein [Candidatus Thalassolituus haligoni]|uniref:TolC family protein n=1 Tax=Candidatus Thalassolituus haligoni TaxID=3100113 RepID=UPI00351154EF|tara:strand:+ start:24066 stop:25421 length:1356 start_codon:yes stop_codon:yes gene_type:complete